MGKVGIGALRARRQPRPPLGNATLNRILFGQLHGLNTVCGQRALIAKQIIKLDPRGPMGRTGLGLGKLETALLVDGAWGSSNGD